MAREIEKLNALAVSRLKESGLHADGRGLYLRVTASGAKSWAFRFMLNGKAREMGLGPLDAVSLADARTKASECRKRLNEGIDPINARNATLDSARLAEAKKMTFRQCAEAHIERNRTGWRNPKHRQQWEKTLSSYVYPVFGDVAVQDVDVGMVLKVLEPIWSTKTETANRIRGRIETILDSATARGYRTGDNPARWRGHLENVLPTHPKSKRVEHHPALPYNQIGGFMKELQAQEGMAALALAFTILTAARTGEVLGAVWDEIDLQGKMWTIPKQRMKGGKEHRAPLSDAAIFILKKLKAEHDLLSQKQGAFKNNYIFFGQKPGRPLSGMSMLMLLRRMNRHDITVHGFRSSFRDWAAEQTSFAREVAESALAHISGDKVELAYRRGDLFMKRRLLMDAWAKFCAQSVKQGGDKVVTIKRRKA